MLIGHHPIAHPSDVTVAPAASPAMPRVGRGEGPPMPEQCAHESSHGHLYGSGGRALMRRSRR